MKSKLTLIVALTALMTTFAGFAHAGSCCPSKAAVEKTDKPEAAVQVASIEPSGTVVVASAPADAKQTATCSVAKTCDATEVAKADCDKKADCAEKACDKAKTCDKAEKCDATAEADKKCGAGTCSAEG